MCELINFFFKNMTVGLVEAEELLFGLSSSEVTSSVFLASKLSRNGPRKSPLQFTRFGLH